MAKNKEETLRILFDRERETKNTVRYEERSEEHDPMIGKLYLKKDAVERMGNPDSIDVAITRVT